MSVEPPAKKLRLAELMACFSLAMDLGLGQPMEWILSTCLAGVRLARHVGLSQAERRQVYYVALLRHIGCTATASWEAAVFGDELTLGDALVTDARQPLEALRFLLATPGRGQSLSARGRHLGRALAAGPAMKEAVDRIQCEVAGIMAGRLNFDVGVRQCLGQIFERWDGQGVPEGRRGDELARPVRVAQLAHDATTLHRLRGLDATIALVRRRAGRLYDPDLAAAFDENAASIVTVAHGPNAWEALLAAEPGPADWLDENAFDAALHAVADFVDLKSPYFAGHSRAVSALARAAAPSCGLAASDVTLVGQAGLIYDLGRVAISAAIWDKPGPLTAGERERVRLHPYYTERILARSATFEPLVAVAGLHHERLDASGYHRGLPAAAQPLSARILAAADVYQALISPRPHRPAFGASAAAREMRREVADGRLDKAATEAVLEAAGHVARAHAAHVTTMLSARESEVLQLLVHGQTNKEIAAALSLSPKTVGHHVGHIYNKLGVNSRAAATLVAAQRGLI